MMKFPFLFLLTVFSCIGLHAQHKEFHIDWSNQKNIAVEEGKQFFVPGFSDAHFNYYPGKEKIVYSAQWEASGNVMSSKLVNVAYEPDRKSTRLNSSHVSISYA